MKRRPFPGSSPPRASRGEKITSSALTLFIAACVYALIVDRVTPHFPKDEDPTAASTLGRFSDEREVEAYVRERVQSRIDAYDARAAATERTKAVRRGEKGDGVAGTERRARDDDDESDRAPAKVIEEGERDERGRLGEQGAQTARVMDDISSRDGYDAEEWRRIRDAETPEDECHELPQSDYWGPQPLTQSVEGVSITVARDCCELCKKTAKCQFWRHDPAKPNECFTGTLINDYLPPMYGEEHNRKTTSGVLYPKKSRYDAESTELKTCVHTMITSNGSPYMNWQTRVFYQTWKKAASEKDSVLRHFTRILHRSTDDSLMDLVPTWRADPTHVECDNSCDYAVKDRARAIAEWMKSDDSRRCSHILMAETDYLFIRSPPPSVLLAKGISYGFLFGYIVPSYPDAKEASVLLHDVSKDGPLKDVYQTGNAPQCIHRDDLERVAPVWADKVEFGESNEVVKRVFGWVRDMYAWSFAAAAVRPKLEFELPPVPFQKLMIQPPADIAIGQSSVMHYTWGAIISNKEDHEVWRFDKREYLGSWDSLKKIEPLPPWDAEQEFKLQDKKRIQKSQYEVLDKMVEIFNEAVDAVVAGDG